MYGSGIFGESCDPSEIGDTGYGGIPTEKTPGGEGQVINAQFSTCKFVRFFTLIDFPIKSKYLFNIRHSLD